MQKNSFALFFFAVTACIVLLTSCSIPPASGLAQDIAITVTATKASVTKPATLTPTPTLVPIDTTTPSPTPMVWPTKPITVDNLNSMMQLDQWGRGTVTHIERLDNRPGEYLALSPLGLYWYKDTEPYLLKFFPDVNVFVLSDDEDLLVISLSSGDVELWAVETMSLTQTISHVYQEEFVQAIEESMILPYYVGGMAFSKDGTQLAIGYVDGIVEVWHVGDTTPYATLQHDSFSLWQTDSMLLFQLSFSPDGKRLSVFKFEPYINANRLTIWSLPEGSLIKVSDAARYYAYAPTEYLPDGKTLLVFTRNESYLDLIFWDVEKGEMGAKFGTGFYSIESTELSPSGDQVTLTGYDTLGDYYRQVRKLPNGNLVENAKLDRLPVNEERFRLYIMLHEQGHYENSWGRYGTPEEAQILLSNSLPFHVVEENYILSLPDQDLKSLIIPENVTSSYYDPQGRYTAWCEPETLQIVDQDGTETSIPLDFNSNCGGLVVSPSKKYAAIWNADGNTFYMVNLTTGKYTKPSFDLQYANSLMVTAVFSDDEQILITSKMGLVTVWQVDPFQRLTDSNNGIYYAGNNVELAITQDKSKAVSLSVSQGTTADRTSQLIIWQTKDATELDRINPPFMGSIQPMFTTFALSSDGRLIASGDDFGGIRLWSVDTGEELAAYQVDGRPLDLAFTPNGTGLVLLLGDGTIHLWGIP